MKNFPKNPRKFPRVPKACPKRCPNFAAIPKNEHHRRRPSPPPLAPSSVSLFRRSLALSLHPRVSRLFLNAFARHAGGRRVFLSRRKITHCPVQGALPLPAPEERNRTEEPSEGEREGEKWRRQSRRSYFSATLYRPRTAPRSPRQSKASKT